MEKGPSHWGCKILGRSPGPVGTASPASSHCLPVPVPQGHGTDVRQEVLAEKHCCKEPDHKMHAGG